jgi:hypothetical protein
MKNGFNLGDSAEVGLSRFFAFLPQLIGAIVLLVIGYFVAVILMRVVQRLLKSVRFDKTLHTSPIGNVLERFMDSPTRFVGKIVYWLVFLGFISLAVAALNLPALNKFMGAIYGYLPHVIAAIVIFLVASAVSAAAVAMVGKLMGRTPLAKMIAAVIPSLTMSIAVFMILEELMIAEGIVMITYTALVGAVSLGLALAFGLGGRDVAARLLEQAYVAGQRNASSAKTEVQRATQAAKREARRASDEL